MATYIVGDIHGCFETLCRLLEKVGFDQEKDHLWLVGDLVNRGPASLEVLRWARRLSTAMGPRFVNVLGNHDLHFLAIHAGFSKARQHDTLETLLEAPDVDALAGWLRACPLVHRRGELLMVHAGLLPSWTFEEAESRARATEELLDRPRGGPVLLADSSANHREQACREALAVFTRLRTCTEGEEPCRFSGPPGEAPEGCRPWFRWPSCRRRGQTVVFGHWAALGLHEEPGIVALDSGCSWGNRLSLLIWHKNPRKRRVLQQSVMPGENRQR